MGNGFLVTLRPRSVRSFRRSTFRIEEMKIREMTIKEGYFSVIVYYEIGNNHGTLREVLNYHPKTGTIFGFQMSACVLCFYSPFTSVPEARPRRVHAV